MQPFEHVRRTGVGVDQLKPLKKVLLPEAVHLVEDRETSNKQQNKPIPEVPIMGDYKTRHNKNGACPL